MDRVLLYFAIIGFFTWFIKSMKIFDYIFRGEFLKSMRECDYCLGFWIAVFLFPFFNVGILDFLYNKNEILIYVINAFITSCISSVLVKYMVTGWKTLNVTIVIK